MKLETVLHQMLGVEEPWQVLKVRDDLGRQQIDIWLGKSSGRGWFFGRSSTDEGPEQVWRHVNIGDCRCVIHAAVPQEESAPSWCGEPGLPFTHGLSRLIATMMRDGIRLQTICDLLDVPVADLWKFKHTLDSGKAGLSGVMPVPTGSMTVDSRVPQPDDPVWARLLDGSAQIDIKLLSLKLFLSKLREQMRVITDSEVRGMKGYELQRYFLRYETALSHELAQLERLR